MKIKCYCEATKVENDRGKRVDAVRVTCSRCGHVSKSYGRKRSSVERCLAKLREECPKDEANYYAGDL